MAFTIYGPGWRDKVSLDNLFRDKSVDPLTGVRRVQPVGEETPSQGEGRTPGEQAASAYESVASRPQGRQIEPALIAEQIMSSPVTTLPPDAMLTQAWQLFRQTRYRHIPVVADGQLEGILSDRDLLRYAAINGRKPPYDDTDSAEAQIPIAALVKQQVVTATPDTEIRLIARLLFEKRIGSMPIVSETDRLVGIVTRSDILRTIIHRAPLELWI